MTNFAHICKICTIFTSFFFFANMYNICHFFHVDNVSMLCKTLIFSIFFFLIGKTSNLYMPKNVLSSVFIKVHKMIEVLRDTLLLRNSPPSRSSLPC